MVATPLIAFGQSSPQAVDQIAKQLAPRPVLESGQSATLLPDGSWLLLGGTSNGAVVKSAQVLAPATGQRKLLVAQLAFARTGHSATLLADGSVLVLGGVDATGTMVTRAERFDLSTSSFTNLPDLGLLPRAYHTATVLVSGQVLIAGGTDASGKPIQEAELYDPMQQKAEPFDVKLDVVRLRQVAALLPTSSVLLYGGVDATGKALTSGSQYEPTAQAFSAVTAAAAQAAAAAINSSAAPAISSSAPAANATNVEVAQPLTVVFSKRMDVASLSTQTVTLLGPNGSVSVKVVPVEEGGLLFVTPERTLAPATQYTLFIKGATDETGQPLAMTTIAFTTSTLAAGATSPGTAVAVGQVVAIATASTPTTDATATAATAATTKPVDALRAALDAAGEDEDWTPNAHNYTGDFRSGRRMLNRRTVPVRDEVRRAYIGDASYSKFTPKQVAEGKASLFPKAPEGTTAVEGQVLRLNGRPLAKVTLTMGGQSTESDANGEFQLTNVPAGHQVLVIEGASADGSQGTYGHYEYGYNVLANKTNVLPFVVWMSRLDPAGNEPIPSPTVQETVLKNPKIPGLELHIPAGTVIRDEKGNIVTQLNMTAIPTDQPPFPIPNLAVPTYFTIQPGGAHLESTSSKGPQGARLIYPNFGKSPAGTIIDFWNYDPASKGWYVYGHGKVSSDTTQIIPDPGVVIYEFTGAMVAGPGGAPASGPSGGCSCGDPVDTGTGLFTNPETDMVIADTIPLNVSRAYRQMDNASRAFGIGTNLSYDMFLVGTSNDTGTSGGAYTYQDLIQADGSHIHFPRISSGTSWADAVYQNTSTSGPFYGATLSWDAGGGVCSTTVGVPWVMTLKNGTRYCFPDSNGATTPGAASIVGVIDRNGNTLTITRDANFNLTKITSPNGRNLTFTYDASNRITLLTDDIGRTVQYGYDTAGRLVKVTDPAGKYEQYTYDANNNMLTVVDKRLNTMVTNTYDANNRVTKQVYADNTFATWAYTITNNSTTQGVYDVCTGQPTTLVGTYGEYNMPCIIGPDGQVTAVTYTDRRGAVTQYTLNFFGFPTTVVKSVGKPEQQSFTYTRDPATNLLSSYVDALSRTTAYQYDALANLTQITSLYGTAKAVSSTFSYDPVFNQLVSVTDALSHSTFFTFDSFGDVIKTTDALGHSTTNVNDSQGRLSQISDALGHGSSLTYSGPDLQSITDALSHTSSFDHDEVGRPRSLQDPLGNVAFLSYDSLNRLSGTTNPTGKTTGRTYDANNNILTQTDEKGNVQIFTYDSMNRAITQKDSLGHTTTYGFEPGGGLNTFTDRKGQVSGATYDSLGRITQWGFGATVANPTTYKSTVSYTYDSANRLTKLVDSVSGTITRSYDGMDRLLQEVTPQGTVTYTYDAAERRASMTVMGAPTISYTWDAGNRLTQISQAAGTTNNNVIQTDSFTYDAANRRTKTTLANGIQEIYTYDNANELTGITYETSSNSQIGTLTYGYDAQGNRVAIGGTFATTTSPAAVSTEVINANNQLTTSGSKTLSYDLDGNLTGDGTNTYTWDERNRLISISGGGTASFQYDPFGRRVSKTIGATTTGFVYDAFNDVQELAGTTSSAAVRYNLVTGLTVDEQLQRMPAAGTSVDSIVTDALGSTVLVTDQTAATVASFTYDAYGNVTQTGTSDISQQFTGRENDGTGLYFYRSRYYSPGLGRFISEDQLGWTSGQTNAYAYVGGNPVTGVDPFGLATYKNGPGGNSYSDTPPDGQCLMAARMGVYIVSWNPCGPPPPQPKGCPPGGSPGGDSPPPPPGTNSGGGNSGSGGNGGGGSGGGGSGGGGAGGGGSPWDTYELPPFQGTNTCMANAFNQGVIDASNTVTNYGYTQPLGDAAGFLPELPFVLGGIFAGYFGSQVGGTAYSVYACFGYSPSNS